MIASTLAVTGAAALGGFAWRVRGGAWETLLKLPPGTTKARLATGVAMSLPLATQLDWSTPLVAASLFAGMAMAGWGDVMDIGRNGGERLPETLGMSGWGLVTISPALVLMTILGMAWWPLLLAGLLFGPIYALCWWLPKRPAIKSFAQGETEWAEVLVGATVGAALMACVL